MKHSNLLKIFVFLPALLAGYHFAGAQMLLQKKVSLSADNTPLGEVLTSIGRQAGFSFSYGSHAVAAKRLVTIHATSISVEQALDDLLKGTCTYKEVGNHVVLQASREKYYQVSGYVLDAENGTGIPEASVYERKQLVAAVTNSEGYFRLRLRNQYPTADISISKERYQDTTVYFASVEDKVYRLPVRAARLHALDEVTVTDNPRKRLLDNFLSGLLLNRRLKAQTRNITRFIAERPVQSSFIPGVGTHGKLGAQVVNKFSLNLIGGYTAGVRGVEIGGVFNIDRGDVGFTQVAGVFNVVGGSLEGVQLGGVANTVQEKVSGIQIAGLSNYAGARVGGLQMSGVSNVAVDSVVGLQMAGVASLARQQVNGGQISGVVNACREVRGIQLSGVVNYTRHLKGMQVGLINIADTSEGVSIGLINLSRNGYHKLAFYGDEIVRMNTALKTGTPALYTILLTGFNPGIRDRAFTFGAGLGHQTLFSKRWSLTTEATVQHLYLGDWNHARLLYRLRPSICYQPNRWFSFYTGPSVAFYENTLATAAPDYIQSPADRGLQAFQVGGDWLGWIGWQLGVALF